MHPYGVKSPEHTVSWVASLRGTNHDWERVMVGKRHTSNLPLPARRFRQAQAEGSES